MWNLKPYQLPFEFCYLETLGPFLHLEGVLYSCIILQHHETGHLENTADLPNVISVYDIKVS